MKFFYLAAVGLALVPISAIAAPNPIKIQQCFITEPKKFSHKAGGTQVDYVNVGTKTATKVTIAVGYANAEGKYLRRVDDIGNFAPHAPIQHHFSLYNDVTYAGKKVTSCKAIVVTFSDGSVWK